MTTKTKGDYRTLTLTGEPFKGAKVDVKYLKTRDLLVLQRTPQRQEEFIQDHVEDDETKEALTGLNDMVATVLIHLLLGTRNYRGFKGIEEGADAMTAWLDNVYHASDGTPLWCNEVFAAVNDTSVLTEDESKN